MPGQATGRRMIPAADGKLPANIAHFARALRKAGLPVGTGRVLDAIRAVEVAGFTDRRDFYFTLQACFVSRPEHREVFAQVFRLFWRDPAFIDHMMALLAPVAGIFHAHKGWGRIVLSVYTAGMALLVLLACVAAVIGHPVALGFVVLLAAVFGFGWIVYSWVATLVIIFQS